jgi:hypothetical protein
MPNGVAVAAWVLAQLLDKAVAVLYMVELVVVVVEV